MSKINVSCLSDLIKTINNKADPQMISVLADRLYHQIDQCKDLKDREEVKRLKISINDYTSSDYKDMSEIFKDCAIKAYHVDKHVNNATKVLSE